MICPVWGHVLASLPIPGGISREGARRIVVATRKADMERINVGIIGTGWGGGSRAETGADSPFGNELHIAETNADRLAEIERPTKPKSATSDYRQLLDNKEIDAI